MNKFDSNEFLSALDKRLKGKEIPVCPYCKGKKFTTVGQYANIVVNDGFEGLELGTTIPAGMIVCENCGHIEFFALGALGLLKGKDDNDEERKEHEEHNRE